MQIARRVLTGISCALFIPGILWSQARNAGAPLPGPAPISLVEINGRAGELQRELAAIATRLPEKSLLESQQETLKNDFQALHARVTDTENLLASNPTLVEVRGEERFWRRYNGPSEARSRIVEAVQQTDRAVASLEQQESTWSATLRDVAPTSGILAVTETVRQSLSDIKRLKAAALERRGQALTLQNQLTRMDLIAHEERDQVQRAVIRSRESLFTRDSYPLWEGSRGRSSEPQGTALNRTLERSVYKSQDFFEQERRTVLGLTILYAFVVWGSLRLRKIFLRAPTPQVSVSHALWLTERPAALAFFLVLPLAIPMLRRAPVGVMVLSMTMLLVSLALIAAEIWRGRARRSMWVISGLFFANSILDLLVLSEELKRNIIVLVTAVTAVGFGLLAWRRTRPHAGERVKRSKVVTYGEYFVSAAFAFSLVANIFGFVTLSQFVRQTAVISAFAGLLAFLAGYAAISITSAVVAVTRLQRLSVVQEHGRALAKWNAFAIVSAGVFFWLVTTLDLLSVRTEVANSLTSVLTARIPLPSVDFSLRDLIVFIAVLGIGYFIAMGIRLTLREDVLPHYKLERGIPELISSTVYYILLLFVFISAISAAGVNLDKFTVLTGALGVGLGFGLQNVVNNFASGMILKVERPINIGDSLDVAAVVGTVSRIGVRSSTIVTPQGAEVIIPNATLVSETVTNWTRHNTCRRVEIPVKVAYGSDPLQVSDVLLAAASRSSGVVKKPPPTCIFKGFGECALEFELMFWTEHRIWFATRSEIAIAIHAALRDAGIEIPLPQREIRVLNVEDPADEPLERPRSISAEAVDGGGGSKLP